MAQVYYSVFDSILYTNNKNIIIDDDSKKKYAKIEFSYDAGNNNAFLKYNDTNYFPHSITITSRGTEKEYLCVIECRFDRKTANKDIMYIVFNVDVDETLSEVTSLSKLAKSLKNTEAQQEVVNFKSVDIIDDENLVKGELAIHSATNTITCSLNGIIKIKDSLGFTESPLITTICPNILLDSVDDMPVIFKKTTLYSVMDCEPIDGEDMSQMKKTNVNELISQEDVLNKTVILFVIFAGIIGIISVFFDTLYDIFVIRFMIDAKIEGTGKLPIAGVNLYWLMLALVFSMSLIGFSLKTNTNQHMIAGIAVGGVFLLFNTLYSYSKKYNPNTAVGDSAERVIEGKTLSSSVMNMHILFWQPEKDSYIPMISLLIAIGSYVTGMVLGFQENAKSEKFFDLFMSLFILFGAGVYFFRPTNPYIGYVIGAIIVTMVILMSLRVEEKL
jgi:hypothetical protein